MQTHFKRLLHQCFITSAVTFRPSFSVYTYVCVCSNVFTLLSTNRFLWLLYRQFGGAINLLEKNLLVYRERDRRMTLRWNLRAIALKMEAANASEMSVNFYQTKRRDNVEGSRLRH
jgi:hypothetical protein